MEVGTSKQHKRLKVLILFIFALNGLDALLTLLWVHAGLAEEANPLLDELVTQRPVLFILAKFALVGGGSYLLWRLRHHALAVVGIFVVFMGYYWIVVYHFYFLGSLL